MNNPYYDAYRHESIRDRASSIFINQFSFLKLEDLDPSQLSKISEQSWAAAVAFANAEQNYLSLKAEENED